MVEVVAVEGPCGIHVFHTIFHTTLYSSTLLGALERHSKMVATANITCIRVTLS